jgi:hypothetical protein
VPRLVRSVQRKKVRGSQPVVMACMLGAACTEGATVEHGAGQGSAQHVTFFIFRQGIFGILNLWHPVSHTVTHGGGGQGMAHGDGQGSPHFFLCMPASLSRAAKRTVNSPPRAHTNIRLRMRRSPVTSVAGKSTKDPNCIESADSGNYRVRLPAGLKLFLFFSNLFWRM